MNSVVLSFLAIFGTWNSVSNHVSPEGYAFLKRTNSLHFLWESNLRFFEFCQFLTSDQLESLLVCRKIIFSLLSHFWLELCRFLVGLGHSLKYLSTDIFSRKSNETIDYPFWDPFIYWFFFLACCWSILAYKN